jgi:hypothetical protein
LSTEEEHPHPSYLTTETKTETQKKREGLKLSDLKFDQVTKNQKGGYPQQPKKWLLHSKLSPTHQPSEYNPHKIQALR